ncbi:hypothetical protein [Streptomyces indicus]|uniref:hypothetical protein n=1 Tax=Streptomyces indicus TaxID=417292 RepID=UPI000B849F21|nr:hypothetical protein [Streptomyces indicus]
MTETEMMQRVIAILTQAKVTADGLSEDEAFEDLNSDTQLIGQLIRETLDFDSIVVGSNDPQDVANAVADALTERVGLLASCFVAAFVHLASHYDAGDGSSARVLQQFALAWELDESD